MIELEKFLREAIAKDELDDALSSMITQVHKPGKRLVQVPNKVYLEIMGMADKENKIPGYGYTKEKIDIALLKIRMGDLV